MPETMPNPQNLINQFVAFLKEVEKTFKARWSFFFILGAIPMVFYFLNNIGLIPWTAGVWPHYILWLLQLAASLFATSAIITGLMDMSMKNWMAALKMVQNKIMKDVLILLAIGFVLLLGLQANIARPGWLAVYLILANIYLVIKAMMNWKLDQASKLLQANLINLVFHVAVVWALVALLYYIWWKIVTLIVGYNLYLYPLLIGLFMAVIWPKVVIYFYQVSKSLKTSGSSSPVA